MKKIKTNPRRGDIFECLFGNYEPLNLASPDGPFRKDNYDRRIPNEIRKKRPVVIVGERKKQFLVVPISSKQDTHPKQHRTGEAVGLHIRLNGNEIPETAQYVAGTVCWAKTDLIQSVDEERLREFRLQDGTHTTGKVTPKILQAIQKGVMRAIGLTPWIEEKEAAEEAILELAKASHMSAEEATSKAE